jgi:hypothetical protein
MTTYYVGIGGNDASAGTSWDARKLTLNGAEDIPVAAGDTVYVGPGTYRELLTVDVSGGNTYSTGTVSVTNGSATVTGSGTTFTGNVAANYIFQSTVLASGTDGVTTAVTATSHTFTSAAGNFQAGHIGMTIRINTIGAYIITACASATSITIAKPDNSSFLMTAGTGLTYNVGPESPYNIASVDSNTQLTLSTVWSGPTLTGLAYLTWNPIKYIGDYTGANTDGVGGVVRITGSDNDQTITRANCITATSKNYRSFSGFVTDGCSARVITLLTACSNWIIDKCAVFCSTANSVPVDFAGTGTSNTLQNSIVFGGTSTASVRTQHSSTANNAGNLFQKNIVLGGTGAFEFVRVGGSIVRNCTIIRSTSGIIVSTAVSVGQSNTANNCLFYVVGTGCQGTAVGEITENYNSFSGCGTNRTNTDTGANSNTYIIALDTRWLFQLVNASNPAQVISPFDLASYSALLNVAGLNPPLTDIRNTAVQGAQREWGALEYDSGLKIKGHTARARSAVGIG